MLEQKLSTLQKLVQNTQESSEGGWQVRICICWFCHDAAHICVGFVLWYAGNEG
jgi:hypothetical protein